MPRLATNSATSFDSAAEPDTAYFRLPPKRPMIFG